MTRTRLPSITVRTPAATAEIHLQGAQVTAWAPSGVRHPVLWMSEQSAYERGRALRGGIPICFPWFGPSPTGSGAQHGFARTAGWTVRSVEEEGDDVRVVLGLDDTPATRATPWPYRFAARLAVRVGATLGVWLEVSNRDEVPFSFSEALHTYLAVSDVREVAVAGLDATPVLDKVRGRPVHPSVTSSGGELRLSEETDRVYAQPGNGLVTVSDPGLGRALEVRSQDSAHAVVWNPWADKAAAMSDVADDGWVSFLCVETANALDRPVILRPGERHTMSAQIAVREI